MPINHDAFFHVYVLLMSYCWNWKSTPEDETLREAVAAGSARTPELEWAQSSTQTTMMNSTQTT